jgi:hypothetical protein
MSQEAISRDASAPTSRPYVPPPLKISLYDQASGMLIALLAIVGTIVLVLILAYLSQNIRFDFGQVPPVLMETEGTGDPIKGVGDELEDPGVEEMPDVMEPQLAATLDNISSVVSVATPVDTFEGTSTLMGSGSSLGSSRAAGTGGSGGGVTPRWERWQVRFSSNSVDVYAKQLDFFGIELAAIGGGSKDVEYALALSKRPIQRRMGPSKDEKRLFMTWTKGALKQFDLQLLQMAGVPMQGKECIQLYPPTTENQMATLENQKLAGKPLKSVKRTVFSVRAAGSGYEMFVSDMQFQ